jgi:hypothetical protein
MTGLHPSIDYVLLRFGWRRLVVSYWRLTKFGSGSVSNLADLAPAGIYE